MAGTKTGARLTEAHRVAQLSIRASFLRELVRMFPLIDLDNLDGSSAAWVNVVTDLIIAHRARSAARALRYYEEFRRVEFGERLPDRDTYVNLGLGRSAAIRTSLLVTGPIGVKSRIAKGFAPRAAFTKAMVDVSGAASRHVLNGGRQMLSEATKKDPVAQGWARVTDANPCAFCAMLASRGGVYKSRFTAERAQAGAKVRSPDERYHDHCGCSVEPVFDRDAPLPGRADEFAKLWEEATGDVYGKNKLRKFREAYEAQRGN